MLELTVDLLNPTVVRFQMMVGAFIALLAIFFTILKAMMDTQSHPCALFYSAPARI